MWLKVKYSFIAEGKTKLDSFYPFESPTKNVVDRRRFSDQLNSFLFPFLHGRILEACEEKVLQIESQGSSPPCSLQ